MADPYSAYKRRQTLAEIGQNGHAMNASQLPQPSSVFRKAAPGGGVGGVQRVSTAGGQQDPPHMQTMGNYLPRSSLRQSLHPQSQHNNSHHQRSLSGGGVLLSDGIAGLGLNAASIQQRESMRGSRQSYAPPSARRSSGYSSGTHNRPSSIGILSATVNSSLQKDPRPVRDKTFQAACQRMILDYLMATAFPSPVSLRTLQTPTSKDFALIFKWLYNRLDPKYQFVKKIEDEVVACLKALKYPFADQISKSQISAVGSMHAWPSILAMLHWMTEICVCIERLESGEIEVEDDDANVSERLFFEYLTVAYRLFLAGDDDFSEAETQLEGEFDQRNAKVLSEIERLERESDVFARELEGLNESAPPLQSLEEERQILQSDKEKFVQYIQHLEAKRQKTRDLLQRLHDEIEVKEEELIKVQKEKAILQSQFSAQDISPVDVDRMTSEREILVKGLEQVSQQVEEASHRAYARETDAQKKLESLERLIQAYNALGYKIGIIPAAATYANNQSYELDIPDTSLRSDHPCNPNEIINRDLRRDVRPGLLKLRQKLNADIHDQQDEALRLKQLVDQVSEGLADKRDELDSLEAKLALTVEQYNEVKDVRFFGCVKLYC